MPTYAVGQRLTAATLEDLAGQTTTKPIGRIYETASQNLADATAVAITFTLEDFDTHSFHSTSSNTSRVTPTVAGYYRFRGTVAFGAQATPVFSDAWIRKNGATDLPGAGRAAGQTSAFCVAAEAIVSMNGSTDYIELIGRQDSAGLDTTNTTSPFVSCLEWEYVRSN